MFFHFKEEGDCIKPSIYDLTKAKLIAWLEARGHKKSRVEALWQELYKNRKATFESMNLVRPELLEDLQGAFDLNPLKEVTHQRAMDGTTKFLFRLADGNLIETVLMVHKFGKSVCVTSQVGCNMGCRFCASGLRKKVRDLSCGEIVGQILAVQQHVDEVEPGESISHLVVMGIGEPFDNYDNVLNFCRIMADQKGLSIAPRHMTISTSGLIPGIERMAEETLPINLAISLHAPTDKIRQQIMPINHKYPLKDLMAALEDYVAKTRHKLTFEYILIKDLNDSWDHAQKTIDLLRPFGKYASINLIPYNEVAENPFKASSPERRAAFFDAMMAGGIYCINRKEKGAEIDAACGQLRSKYLNIKDQEKNL